MTINVPPPSATRATPNFGYAEAETFLHRLFANAAPPIRFDSFAEISGPDGFPYFALHQAFDGKALDGIQTAQRLLNGGFGLALYASVGDAQPIWVYKYRDLLCFSVFNSLRPQPRFDETRYPNTLDKPVPAGTRITEGSPSDAILPAHALKTVSRLLSERCGKPITLLPRLFEMPQIDDLFRIKLNSGLGNLPPRERGHLNAVVAWCLPYATYL